MVSIDRKVSIDWIVARREYDPGKPKGKKNCKRKRYRGKPRWRSLLLGYVIDI